MKQTFLLLILAASLFVSAQDKKVPEIDFDNTPMLYNEVTGKVSDLEVTPCGQAGKTKGLLGGEGSIYLEGASSPIKIEKDAAVFVIKVEAGKDPHTIVDLNLATTNTKTQRREFVIMKKGAVSNETVNKTVPIKFEKLATGVYLIRPLAPLDGGEYFFSPAGSKMVYAFSVNGATATTSEKPRPKDPLAGAIYDKIQKDKAEKAAKEQAQQPAPTNTNKPSVSDEIIKLKKLLDDGIITQQEFDTQKKKLLDGN